MKYEESPIVAYANTVYMIIVYQLLAIGDFLNTFCLLYL